MSNNLNLNKVEQRKDELEMVIRWKIIPQLHLETEYRVTIAYNTDEPNLQNIKILGFYKGFEISEKILKFFDKFLTNNDDFGLLVESREGDEVKNWDISFSRTKAE